MSSNDGTILMEGVQILFRNFKGAEGPYNSLGGRNFCVLLPEDVANQMAQDGWNVRTLRSREPDDEPARYIRVAVSYKIRAPRVVLLSSKGRVPLPEDLVELADVVDVEFADLVIRPRHWVVSGNTGIKAYLQSVYLKIREDPLDAKYAHIPLAEGAAEMAELGVGNNQLQLESTPHFDYEGEVVEG